MNVMRRASNIPKIEYDSMKTQATQKEIRKEKKKKEKRTKQIIGWIMAAT